MIKFILPFLLIFQTCTPAFASNAGYIDANGIKNMAHTKSWAMPAATGTLSCIACTESPTNKTIVIGSNTFTGQFTPANGGLGLNASSSTGVVQFSSGTASIAAVSLSGSNVSGNLPVTNLNSGTSASNLTFWRGDGVWATPAGGGTVTSVSQTVPSFLSISGSPVTGAGTLAISYSGTALPIANGGTSATSANAAFNALSPMTTGGDLIYGGASGAATRLANGTAGQVLTSSGTTVAPTWTSKPGSFYWKGYYPSGGSNYWSRSGTSIGNFTVVGTIPTPTVLVNSGFTVSNATSSLPGISFSAPRTGTLHIKMTPVVQIGSASGDTTGAVTLNETTTSTVLDLIGGNTANNAAFSMVWPMSLEGYITTTSGTTYNFNLQGSASTDSIFIALGGISTTSILSISMEYIN